jgi:diguanylate cyclase (GGDEF)-like protein
VILGARDREEAAGFCERVRSAVEGKEFLCAGTTLRLTISLGYALAEPGERGGLELVARADRALYAAKAAGRNAVRGSDE